jgi:hypothetical protein
MSAARPESNTTRVAAAGVPPAGGSSGGQGSKAALLVVFLTVFIDLLGFGIVLPVMPRQAEPYLQALGLSPVAIGAVIGVLFSLSSLANTA